ncbi:ribbon-helix-helix protein, CopG family [Phytoactinopolyspora alkaliphila]|uniref:Ribbon-helix-helix protein, CopG family n=1 Tax=Phytoactinopolyspora alkaliphila TaxID=1783498 RepID=A0A6N9YN63_9ACTN|nr:ribbon-helix-helix domain-containing protein [Phytoactinopolyspora alkaliphila]NED96433.1 ribbon-helix-helix protein, CopG family [Phytoactinopolyspora alkaliphila]
MTEHIAYAATGEHLLFRSLDKLARRLGGTSWEPGDPAAKGLQTIVIYRGRRPNRTEVTTVKVPAEALDVADQPQRHGRPNTGTLINGVRLPDELLAEVDAYATAEGLSRAAAVRALLTHAVNDLKR